MGESTNNVTSIFKIFSVSDIPMGSIEDETLTNIKPRCRILHRSSGQLGCGSCLCSSRRRINRVYTPINRRPNQIFVSCTLFCNIHQSYPGVFHVEFSISINIVNTHVYGNVIPSTNLGIRQKQVIGIIDSDFSVTICISFHGRCGRLGFCVRSECCCL